MAKYHTRRVMVEAEQFNDRDNDQGSRLGIRTDIHANPIVQTRDGPALVSDGDWIVTDAKGNRTVCDNDTFGATHEAIADDPVPDFSAMSDAWVRETLDRVVAAFEDTIAEMGPTDLQAKSVRRLEDAIGIDPTAGAIGRAIR